MANKVLLSFAVIDVVFALTGALMLGFSIIVQNSMFLPATDGQTAATNLFYQQFPLTAGIANGALVLATFALSIPAMTTNSRNWLKASGYMTVACALFSLVLGLYVWILTLTTKELFSPIWNSQTPQVQGLMQTAFQCCGYFNSTSPAFQTDTTCPSPAAAALVRGCATPITSFANVFLDDIFTAVFGMVGVDGVLIMATACLLKDRKERERFRHIDLKTGPVSTF